MNNNILEAIVRKTREAEKLTDNIAELNRLRDSLSWAVAAAAVTGGSDEIYEILAQRDEVDEQIAVLEQRIEECNRFIERMRLEERKRTEKMPKFGHKCRMLDIQLLIDKDGCLRGIKL